MDIAKYIGQYILKNNFCYIHGLGNMELVKRPSMHDGKLLSAPTYEVIVTSGGSIDDSFANFIATNEQISISKAANSLREFSINARKELQVGKEVPIPGMGKFYEEGGKVKFSTDASFRFTPEGMPALKNSRQLEEQKNAPVRPASYPAPVAKPSAVNWTTVGIAVILLVLVAAGGFGFYYYKKQQQQNTPVVDTLPKKDTVVPVAAPVVDTMAKHDTIATPPPPPVDTNAINTFKMVIMDTTNKAYVMKRYRQLKITGYKIEMLTKDSLDFKILAEVNCRFADTLHAKDSLRRLFGYKQTTVYHETK